MAQSSQAGKLDTVSHAIQKRASASTTLLLVKVPGNAPLTEPADSDVSRVSKPAGSRKKWWRLSLPPAADGETGNTAGLETCATISCPALHGRTKAVSRCSLEPVETGFVGECITIDIMAGQRRGENGKQIRPAVGDHAVAIAD